MSKKVFMSGINVSNMTVKTTDDNERANTSKNDNDLEKVKKIIKDDRRITVR